MRDCLFRKGLVVGIIILFIGMSVIPSSGKIDVAASRTTIYDGSLSGYVNDTSMNPIEGALVRVYFHETYEEDYSNSSGYYHVTNIPICYCLKNATCSKEGYKTEWILLGIVEDTTHDFILTSINNPPSAPTIDGPKNGRVGIEYEYTFNTTDDDGDDVIYYVDWGDDSPIEIVVPTGPDGTEAKASHKWNKQGTYGIKAKTKGASGLISEWSEPYPVTMPRNRAVTSPFLNFLQNHLNLFPILQRLLQRLGLQ